MSTSRKDEVLREVRATLPIPLALFVIVGVGLILWAMASAYYFGSDFALTAQRASHLLVGDATGDGRAIKLVFACIFLMIVPMMWTMMNIARILWSDEADAYHLNHRFGDSWVGKAISATMLFSISLVLAPAFPFLYAYAAAGFIWGMRLLYNIKQAKEKELPIANALCGGVLIVMVIIKMFGGYTMFGIALAVLIPLTTWGIVTNWKQK